MLLKLPDGEGGQRPAGLEVGAEQDATRFDPPGAQKVLKEVRRHGQHGDPVTYKRQRR